MQKWQYAETEELNEEGKRRGIKRKNYRDSQLILRFILGFIKKSTRVEAF